MSQKSFSGLSDLEDLFKLTLHSKEKILRTALVDRPLVYLIGEKFSDYYMDLRIKSGIFLKSLRFSDKVVDNPDHKNYKNLNKEVRVAPFENKIIESLIIWDDYVVNFNSSTVSGSITQDKGHAQEMKKWFDLIWKTSRN